MHWLLYVPALIALAYLPRTITMTAHPAAAAAAATWGWSAVLRGGALVLIAGLGTGRHYAVALLAAVAYTQLSAAQWW